MKDLISVIIPVYKVEPYLRGCIESVLKQTYSNIQVILVDDGSPDSCGYICDEYAKIDNRVKVIHKENAGQSAGRNDGLDIASGNYIVFLDSDDTIEPDFLKTLYNATIKYNADIACCGVRKIYQNKTESKSSDLVLQLTSQEALSDLLQQKHVRFEVWNKIYKREVIGDIRFKEGQIHEEIYFLSNVLLNCQKIVYVDKALHNYLIDRPGSTNSYFKENRMAMFEELDILDKRLIDNNMQDLLPDLYRLEMDFALTFYRLALQAESAPEGIEKRIYEVFNRAYNKLKDKGGINNKKYVLFKKAPQLYLKLVQIKDKFN